MLESIRKILVPTDFSDLSQDALRTASEFARRDDASILLLHSIRLPVLHTSYDVNVPEAVWQGLRKETNERMIESRKWLEDAGIKDVETLVTEVEQPAEAIRRSVEEHDIDLVVMSAHGRRGFRHAMVGSVTERTVRACPIPVLAVKGGGISELPLRRILLAVDFSEGGKPAVDLAASLARRFDAGIDVVTVFEPVSDFMRFLSALATDFEEQSRKIAEDRLDELSAQLEGDDISVQKHLMEGHPADVISAAAERLGSDLIVMGTRGHSALDRVIIGSVAEHTLRLAPCSVLLAERSKDSDASA